MAKLEINLSAKRAKYLKSHLEECSLTNWTTTVSGFCKKPIHPNKKQRLADETTLTSVKGIVE